MNGPLIVQSDRTVLLEVGDEHRTEFGVGHSRGGIRSGPVECDEARVVGDVQNC